MSVTVGTGTLNYGGSVVPAIDGDIYLFATVSNGASLKIWKSTDGGANFNALSDVTNTTIFGGSTYYIYGLNAKIDSAGYIHVVCQTGVTTATRPISYCTLNTSNDSWGTWELAATLTKTCAARAVIAVDSNNKPHILFTDAIANMGTDYPRIYYTNKVGASWLTPEAVSTGTTTNHSHPVLTVCAQSGFEGVCCAGTGTVYRSRPNSTQLWGAQTAITNGDSMAAITAKPGGTIYRYTQKLTADYNGFESGAYLFGSPETQTNVYNGYTGAMQ